MQPLFIRALSGGAGSGAGMAAVLGKRKTALSPVGIVLQHQLGIEMRHRRHQRRPRPVPGVRLASRRTNRSSPRPVVAANAGSAVGHRQLHAFSADRGADAHLAAGGRVFDGIVHQIGQRLGN